MTSILYSGRSGTSVLREAAAAARGPAARPARRRARRRARGSARGRGDDQRPTGRHDGCPARVDVRPVSATSGFMAARPPPRSRRARALPRLPRGVALARRGHRRVAHHGSSPAARALARPLLRSYERRATAAAAAAFACFELPLAFDGAPSPSESWSCAWYAGSSSCVRPSSSAGAPSRARPAFAAAHDDQHDDEHEDDGGLGDREREGRHAELRISRPQGRRGRRSRGAVRHARGNSDDSDGRPFDRCSSLGRARPHHLG